MKFNRYLFIQNYYKHSDERNDLNKMILFIYYYISTTK